MQAINFFTHLTCFLPGFYLRNTLGLYFAPAKVLRYCCACLAILGAMDFVVGATFGASRNSIFRNCPGVESLGCDLTVTDFSLM